MTSAKRNKANPRNARKSTGPKSAGGKAQSRMNALKHFLDALTLILPGENESDYRDRFDAWTAVYPPRDPLEKSLLEQAVRLSWQLDRADRVCTAHLVERIQLLQSPEYQRQQATAAAAEAAWVGDQLLADPTPPKYNLAKIHARLVRLRQTEFAALTPIFDLPTAQAKLARKRFRMPIPPDDPAHPERLLRRLKSTAAGCAWLLDRWADLLTALEQNNGWQPEERLRAVRLLAKLPADAVDDPTVRTIYFSCVILGEKDAQVFADQVREMADCEFEYFVERMAGRGLTGQAPPNREAAREWLLWMVDGVVIELRARAAMHAERERVAMASDRLAFDPSPGGRRLLRLQSRLLGSLLRTINHLTVVRRRPAAVVRRQERAENLAVTPREATNCEKVRNEPNADPGSGPETPPTGAFRAAADGDLVGWVQPTGCPALSSAGFTHPTPRNVAATHVATMGWERMRNEPNAPDRDEGFEAGKGEEGGQTASSRTPHPAPAPRPNQTSTQTSSPRTSHRNRCTELPRTVMQRPSARRNRQWCSGQTTSPSSIQPRPSGPLACGQRPEIATTSPPLRKIATRRPAASRETPRPSLISSSRQTATHSAINRPPRHQRRKSEIGPTYDLRPRPPSD